MVIQVELSEVIIKRYPGLFTGKTMQVQLPNDADANDLLEKLGLTKSAGAVIVKNGKVQKPDSRLNDGDCVTILPVVEGG